MTCVIGTDDPTTFFERSDKMKMRLLVLGLVFMGSSHLLASSAHAILYYADISGPSTIPPLPR